MLYLMTGNRQLEKWDFIVVVPQRRYGNPSRRQIKETVLLKLCDLMKDQIHSLLEDISAFTTDI